MRRYVVVLALLAGAVLAAAASAGTPRAVRIVLQPEGIGGFPVALQLPTALSARDLAQRFDVPTELRVQDAAVAAYSAGGRKAGVDQLLSLVVVFARESDAHRALLHFVTAPGGGSAESVEHLAPPAIGDEATASATVVSLPTFHLVEFDLAWRYERAVVYLDALGDANTSRRQVFAIARAQQRRLAAALR